MITERINGWLDRLPRSHLRVGAALVPSYVVFGLAGWAAATAMAALLAIAAGRDVLFFLSLAPLSAGGFVAWGLLRRAITRGESTVLLEHLLLVLSLAWGAARFAGEPTVSSLDLVAAPLSLFMAFGRVGCLVGGCCYGVPAALGVRYPPECGHATPSRRLPLPLLEIAVWLLLAAAATVALFRARAPGSALATVLVGYGVVRLFLESLRDDPRPRWLGRTEGWCLAVVAVALGIAAVHPALPAPRLAALAIGALVTVVVLWGTRRWWLALDHAPSTAQREAMAALGQRIAAGPLGGQVTMWPVADLAIGTSMRPAPAGAVLTLSIAGTARPLVHGQAAALLEAVLAGLGAPPDDRSVHRLANGVFAVDVAVPPAVTLLERAAPRSP